MKNWKTTAAGLIAAAANVAIPMITTGAALNWQAVAVSAGLAAIGYLAKDSNVTGGTVAQ